MSDDDMIYITEEIEDEYDGARYLQRIDSRNRMLVKWTKLGPIVLIERNE
tara:strand:- start:339 stop:488 length:150 start_codon:yes stop_codon:yes gene_type:complete